MLASVELAEREELQPNLRHRNATQPIALRSKEKREEPGSNLLPVVHRPTNWHQVAALRC